MTVVVPTHGRPDRLPRAVDSVLSQTHEDLQLLVVDDASSVAASHVLAGRSDPRLDVRRHAVRRGASAARNTGLAAATGEYVAFLDDDDTWRPRKLERQVACLDASPPGTGAVACGHELRSDRHPEPLAVSVPTGRAPIARDFLLSTRFPTSIPLLRRSCLREVGGFDETLTGCQDRDLWVRLALRFAFAAVPEVLAVHQVHGGQITSDLPAKIHAKEAFLAKHRALIESDPVVLADTLARLGLLHCAAGDAETGRRRLLQSLGACEAPDVREQLHASLADSAAHARTLVAERYTGADGIARYY